MEEKTALKIHDLLSVHPSWTAASDLPAHRGAAGMVAGGGEDPGGDDPRRRNSRHGNEDRDQPDKPPGGWQPSGGRRMGRPTGRWTPPMMIYLTPQTLLPRNQKTKRRKGRRRRRRKKGKRERLPQKFGEPPIKVEPDEADEKRKKTINKLRNSLGNFQQGAGIDLVGLIKAIGKITKPEKVDSTKDLTLPD